MQLRGKALRGKLRPVSVCACRGREAEERQSVQSRKPENEPGKAAKQKEVKQKSWRYLSNIEIQQGGSARLKAAILNRPVKLTHHSQNTRETAQRNSIRPAKGTYRHSGSEPQTQPKMSHGSHQPTTPLSVKAFTQLPTASHVDPRPYLTEIQQVGILWKSQDCVLTKNQNS